MRFVVLALIMALLFHSSASFALTSSLSLKNRLRNECGSRFDGVNATYLAGLQSSLNKRKKSSYDKTKNSEMRELRCRIRILKQIQ